MKTKRWIVWTILLTVVCAYAGTIRAEEAKTESKPQVTKIEQADNPTYTETYYVADLVLPIPYPFYEPAVHSDPKQARPLMQIDGRPMAKSVYDWSACYGGPEKPPAKPEKPEPDFDSLIDLITQTIRPESWLEKGSSGTISEYEGNLSLVIRQTEDVHEEIKDLLKQLRKMQDLLITVKMNYIRMPKRLMKLGGVEVDPQKGWASLDSLDAQLLLRLAERSNKAEVLQSPKVTMLNGQMANLSVSVENGQTLSTAIQSVVSDDRQYVRVALSLNQLPQPDANLVISVKSGDAVLYDVTKLMPGGKDDTPMYLLVCPTIISKQEEEEKVRMASRPKNVAPLSAQPGLIMGNITPRIIIQEEEEERIGLEQL